MTIHCPLPTACCSQVEEYTDLADLEAVLKKRAAGGGGVRLVWIETPANPTWEVVDIGAVAALVGAHCPAAEVAVDATALTPLLCQPLKHGALPRPEPSPEP